MEVENKKFNGFIYIFRSIPVQIPMGEFSRKIG